MYLSSPQCLDLNKDIFHVLDVSPINIAYNDLESLINIIPRDEEFDNFLIDHVKKMMNSDVHNVTEYSSTERGVMFVMLAGFVLALVAAVVMILI